MNDSRDDTDDTGNADEPIDYPFEAFLEDFDAFWKLERPAEPSLEWSVIRVKEYMEEKYGDIEDARTKTVRFSMILMYLAEHVSDFDVGDYGVEGSEESGSLISEYILRAAHQVFTQDRAFPTREPSPELILHLAREFKDAERTA